MKINKAFIPKKRTNKPKFWLVIIFLIVLAAGLVLYSKGEVLIGKAQITGWPILSPTLSPSSLTGEIKTISSETVSSSLATMFGCPKGNYDCISSSAIDTMSQLSLINSQLTATRTELTLAKQDIGTKDSELFRQKALLDASQTDLAATTERATSLEGQLKERTDSLNTAEVRVQLLEGDKTGLQGEVASLRSQRDIEKTNADYWGNQYNLLKVDASSAYQSLEAKNQENLVKVASLEADRVSLNSRVDSLTSNNLELQTIKTKVEKERDDLFGENSQLRESISVKTAETGLLSTEVGSLRAQIANKDLTLGDTLNSLNEANQERTELAAKRDTLQAECDTLAKTKGELEVQVAGLASENQNLVRQHEAIMKDAGSAYQELDKTYQEAIGQKTNLEREVSSLTTTVQQEREEKGALILKVAEREALLQEKGAAIAMQEQAFSSVNVKLAESSKSVEAYKVDAERLSGENAQIKEAVNQKTVQLASTNQELATEKVQRTVAEKERDELSAKKGQLESSLASWQQNFNEINNQYQNLATNSDTAYRLLKQDNENKASQINLLNVNAADLGSQITRLTKSEQELQSSLATVRGEKDFTEQRLGRSEGELAAAKDSLNLNQDELTKLNEENKAAKEKIAALEKEKAGLAYGLKKMEETVKVLFEGILVIAENLGLGK